MSAGIDYGMGQTNIDHATGIRFGVINQNSLGEFALEDFVCDYGEETCPSCGNPVVESSVIEAENDGLLEEFQLDADKDYYCRGCDESYCTDDCYGDEPIGQYLDQDGYKAELHSDGDIFVTKSPYYTWAQFCSPCAPGAGHLNCTEGCSPENGVKTYCLDGSFFEGDKAPYPIYRVDNDEEVK